MTQTRWHCVDCHREWVFATGWDQTSCPVCRAANIKRVTYAAMFPGADIGTTADDVASEPPPSDPPPAIDRKQVHIHENQTLSMACPEFA